MIVSLVRIGLYALEVMKYSLLCSGTVVFSVRDSFKQNCFA